MANNIIKCICGLFLTIVICSCSSIHSFFERRTRVIIIDEPKGVTFKLTGSGEAAVIFVHGPYNSLAGDEIDNRISRNDHPLWQIYPVRGMDIEDMPVIVYGTLPNGFRQELPKDGKPPELVSGKCYEIMVPTHGANGGSRGFCMKDGKAIVKRIIDSGSVWNFADFQTLPKDQTPSLHDLCTFVLNIFFRHLIIHKPPDLLFIFILQFDR